MELHHTSTYCNAVAVEDRNYRTPALIALLRFVHADNLRHCSTRSFRLGPFNGLFRIGLTFMYAAFVPAPLTRTRALQVHVTRPLSWSAKRRTAVARSDRVRPVAIGTLYTALLARIVAAPGEWTKLGTLMLLNDHLDCPHHR